MNAGVTTWEFECFSDPSLGPFVGGMPLDLSPVTTENCVGSIDDVRKKLIRLDKKS